MSSTKYCVYNGTGPQAHFTPIGAISMGPSSSIFNFCLHTEKIGFVLSLPVALKPKKKTKNTDSLAHCCCSLAILRWSPAICFRSRNMSFFTNRIACKLEISQLVKPNCISLAHDLENTQYGDPGTSQYCQVVAGFLLLFMSKILAIIIYCDIFSVNSLLLRLLVLSKAGGVVLND